MAEAKSRCRAALNIIQERFQKAEPGRTRKRKGEQPGEEHRLGRGEGREEREKRSCIIFIRKDSRSCLKSFCTSTSPFFRKLSYQEDVNRQNWLVEQHPLDAAVTMTTEANKSWSL